MTSKFRKPAAFIMTLVIITCVMHIDASAEDIQYKKNISVIVDGSERGIIPALDDDYADNLYVSLKGLSNVLSGTSKTFDVSVDKKTINIVTNADSETSASAWSEDEISRSADMTAGRNELYINDVERKYHSFIISRNGEYDAFFSPISLSLMLNMNIGVDNGSIQINTSMPYSLSVEELESSGCLQGVNSLVIGDATTGEIFYKYCDEPFPIASTTKLMTYFVLMDAVANGECSLEDIVQIPGEAVRLSLSPDGTIPMKEGMSVPITELIYGMLLPSSNECAYAIANHVGGSHEAFVNRMNEKAVELGLENAKFYNCHGLPKYDAQALPAKMQNHMTAGEMFELCSALMASYPQIADVTSVKLCHLDTLNKDIKNTNALLYNMDNVTGLKTGTTNRAGSCLVTCAAAEKDGQKHNLISVLLGAEDEMSRAVISEISERYAIKCLKDGITANPSNTDDNSRSIPDDPETVVKRLIKQLEKNGG